MKDLADPMTYVKQLQSDLENLRSQLEACHTREAAVRCILSSIIPDRVPGPFISGVVGEEGEDGLHDGYVICPMYGSDPQCSAVFKRVK